MCACVRVCVRVYARAYACVCVSACVCGRKYEVCITLAYPRISSFCTIPAYTHTSTRAPKPFEDSQPTGLKVDTATNADRPPPTPTNHPPPPANSTNQPPNLPRVALAGAEEVGGALGMVHALPFARAVLVRLHPRDARALVLVEARLALAQPSVAA